MGHCCAVDDTCDLHRENFGRIPIRRMKVAMTPFAELVEDRNEEDENTALERVLNPGAQARD